MSAPVAIACAVLAAAVAIGAIGAAPSAAAAAEPHARTLRWSGYRWEVRSTTGRENPGNNRWGDSRANVRVRRDGTLRLAIAGGRSAELTGPRTGYGRYRWVVGSDLSTADPFRVAAFFVYGDAGERDLEFSRWGMPDLGTPGTWVAWRRQSRLGFSSFPVSAAPPYTLEIDWRPGATRFAMRDGTGTSLLDTTFPSTGGARSVAPHMSYWRYSGRGPAYGSRAAAAAGAVPPVIMRSFRYTPARR